MTPSSFMRFTAVLAALLLSTLALAAGPATQGGDTHVIVTLDAVAAIDGVDSIAARLAATYGGTVTEKDEAGGERFVMRLPAARARLLAKDPSVAALEPVASAAGTPPAAVVDWTAGVSYSYDGSGNVRQIGNDAFAYDTANRLVHARVNNIRRAYSYDAPGNRTGCTQPEGNCQAGATIRASNNKIAEATYDSSGNVTRFGASTYTYDAADMMTAASINGSVREYVYTADDERLAVIDHRDGTWRWTLRDRSNKVLRELTSSGATGWRWTKDLVYRDGLLVASRQPESGSLNPTRYHYHLDHLGTPRRITNERDRTVGFHDYHAFGPELSGGLDEPSTTAQKYTGHERDLTFDGLGALDYMHARYYDPAIGRFLSVDPTWESADLGRPQSWNRYAYVENSPISRTDPDGRVAFGVVGKLIKLIIKGGDVGSTVAGVVEDVQTIRSANASTGQKVMAGVSIVTEVVSPVSARDVKNTYKAGRAAYHRSRREALREAKRANDVPVSSSPTRTVKPNTPEGDAAGLRPGENIRQYEYKDSQGNVVLIREDAPKTYPDGGKQGPHFNSGRATDTKLRDHDYYPPD